MKKTTGEFPLGASCKLRPRQAMYCTAPFSGCSSGRLAPGPWPFEDYQLVWILDEIQCFTYTWTKKWSWFTSFHARMCTRLTQITIDKNTKVENGCRVASCSHYTKKRGDVLVYPGINVYIDMQESQRSFFRSFSLYVYPGVSPWYSSCSALFLLLLETFVPQKPWD